VGDVAFLVAMGLVVVGWVSLEQRRAARSDARLDAEVAAAELAARGSSAE